MGDHSLSRRLEFPEHYSALHVVTAFYVAVAALDECSKIPVYLLNTCHKILNGTTPL